MTFEDLIKAMKAAKASNHGTKITECELKLELLSQSLHPTFWSAYRISDWREAMGGEPVVPSLQDHIGTAVFPVVENDAEANALYRFVITAIPSGGPHQFDDTFSPETQERLRTLLKTVGLSTTVKVEVHLEPEFEPIRSKLSQTPIEGRSMELALYVAAETFRRQRPFRSGNDERYVFTGQVQGGGILKIEHLKEKAACVSLWRPQSTLIAPVQEHVNQFSQVKSCRTLTMLKEVLRGPSNSWKKRFETVSNEHEHQSVVQLGLELWSDLQDLPVATASDISKTRYKIRILMDLIAAYNHLGRAAEAMPLVENLQRFLQEPTSQAVMQQFLKEGEDWQYLLAVCAVSFLDDFRLEEGLSLYDIPLAQAFSNRYRIHYLGSKASLYMAMGNLTAAKELYAENLEISRIDTPSQGETVRIHCYYGNVLRLLGEYEAAEDVFLKGLELSEEDPDLYDVSESGNWVRWQYAKLLHDTNRHDEVTALIEDIPVWMEWSLMLSYPTSESDIETGKKALSKSHPECRLYQSAILRAEAQLHIHNGENIPDDLLAKLRGLHHSWSELAYAELWKRIPY